MTVQAAILTDGDEAETRWRDWQARGVASDRRTAVRMRGVLLLLAGALALWFFSQFA